MNYESFRDAWNDALCEARLPTIGLYATELLDTRMLDREYKVYVEPLGGQDAEPFHVTATLSWSWHALHTARAATKDEDILSPRVLDGSDRVPDEGPEEQLAALFARVRASLMAWMQAVDHLAPATRTSKLT